MLAASRLWPLTDVKSKATRRLSQRDFKPNLLVKQPQPKKQVSSESFECSDVWGKMLLLAMVSPSILIRVKLADLC